MCEWKENCPYGKNEVCDDSPSKCVFKEGPRDADKLQEYNEKFYKKLQGAFSAEVHEQYMSIPETTSVLHDTLPLKYGSEFVRPQEFRKRQESGSYILKDDILNLRISLETTRSVDEFISLL